MSFTCSLYPDEGERFGPSAFDSQIGKTIKVNYGGKTVSGTVAVAEVAADGSHVELTVDADMDDLLPDWIRDLDTP
jgi:hypothetical protein